MPTTSGINVPARSNGRTADQGRIRAAGALLVSALALPSLANASLLTNHPDLSGNSSELGVAVNSKGQVFATDGISISTIHFDGTPETVTPFGFTTDYTGVSRIRFDKKDQLNLLVAYFNGGGSVGIFRGGTYNPYLPLDASFHYARNMDFTPDGRLWLDANVDFGDPGVVRQYDASAHLLSTQNLSYNGFGPTALSHDSQGREYASTFDGTILDLSGATPTPIASVAGTWAGPFIGTVTAFAIDDQGDIFLAVNRGTVLGPTEGDVLRLNPDKSIDVLQSEQNAYPLDMVLSDNNLYVATFHVNETPTIDEITGVTPEPTSLPVIVFLLVGLTGRRRTISTPLGNQPGSTLDT